MIINWYQAKEMFSNFAKERDWNKFHTPKNLACALSVEASELLEEFQWMSENEQKEISKEKINSISEELSDILTYAIRLAGILDINLVESLEKKIVKNGEKYPVERVKGSSKKYTEY